MGLLVGHGSLLLNLRCNARDSRLYAPLNYCGNMRSEGKALSMVTPRYFGREVVLRVVASSYTDDCQRASFELLVKNATSDLLVFVMASCLADSVTSLLEWLLKSETSSANMATSTLSGMTRRRSSMYNRKRSGDRTDP